MRYLIASFMTLFATGAHAHVGHLSEAAGHGHWLGAAALGGAIAIGLWAAAKGRKGGAQDSNDADTDEAGNDPAAEDPQEA